VCRAEVYRDREPKFPILFGLICCAALTLALVAHAGQKKVPPGSVFVQEKGKFDILLEGKSVGHEEFDIEAGGAGWVAKGTTKLTPPGSPTSTVTGNLVLQADGAPVSYAWTSQADKTNGAHIVFVNGIAKMTLEIQGARPFEQDLSFNSPLITVLDNNLYHQYGLLARMYDWSRRGTQTFSVLIPQDLTPGSITVDWAGAVSSDGKAYEGLKVVTSDLEVMLYLDPNHKLMRLEVPSAKVAVVRQ
jgi:methionine-rich copper-binding protein CopC